MFSSMNTESGLSQKRKVFVDFQNMEAPGDETEQFTPELPSIAGKSKMINPVHNKYAEKKTFKN